MSVLCSLYGVLLVVFLRGPGLKQVEPSPACFAAGKLELGNWSGMQLELG